MHGEGYIYHPDTMIKREVFNEYGVEKYSEVV